MSRFALSLFLLGALLLGTAWIVESREVVAPGATEEPALPEAPIAGYRAPDFTLTTLTGDTVRLSDYRGQPVVVNFWATWCPPCRAEIPHFQAASRRYNGRIIFLGVDDGEPVATVAPFAAKMGITYPIPLDTESAVSRLYRVNSLPSTFFIDASGVIRHVQFGLVTEAVLEENVQVLLADEGNAAGP